MAKGKCSFCYCYLSTVDRTHNKSSCKERIKAKLEWVETNKTWAVNFKKKMMEAGYGIGSIIEVTDWGGDKSYGIIREIDFENLSQDRQISYAYLNMKYIDHPERDQWWYIMNASYPGADSFGNNIVASKLDPEIVEKQFPRDWETGLYGVPRHLKDTERRTRVNSKPTL